MNFAHLQVHYVESIYCFTFRDLVVLWGLVEFCWVAPEDPVFLKNHMTICTFFLLNTHMRGTCQCTKRWHSFQLSYPPEFFESRSEDAVIVTALGWPGVVRGWGGWLRQPEPDKYHLELQLLMAEILQLIGSRSFISFVSLEFFCVTQIIGLFWWTWRECFNFEHQGLLWFQIDDATTLNLALS